MPEQNAVSRTLAEIVARSWDDPDFRATLLADPAATLAASGFAAPEGKRVVVVEDTDEVIHLVLPVQPAELSDEELDAVAGGLCANPSVYTQYTVKP